MTDEGGMTMMIVVVVIVIVSIRPPPLPPTRRFSSFVVIAGVVIFIVFAAFPRRGVDVVIPPPPRVRQYISFQYLELGCNAKSSTTCTAARACCDPTTVDMDKGDEDDDNDLPRAVYVTSFGPRVG